MDRKTALKNYYQDYRNRLNQLFDSVNIDEMEKVIATIITTFKRGNTLFVCGNGGSAATASHIQADFSFFVRQLLEMTPHSMIFL